MKPYRAKASLVIDAPAKRIYDLIADYHNGHPRIIPRRYFVSLDVESGGVGSGTIISFQMRIFGKVQSFRAAVSEPVPGRTLVETGLEPDGVVTTFDVTPMGAVGASVIITTDGKTQREGLMGTIERLLTKMFLERVYREELKQLSNVAKQDVN